MGGRPGDVSSLVVAGNVLGPRRESWAGLSFTFPPVRTGRFRPKANALGIQAQDHRQKTQLVETVVAIGNQQACGWGQGGYERTMG